MTKVIDLSTLDVSVNANKGAVLSLKHPTKNTELGITITLVGEDSGLHRRAVANIANRRAKNGFRKNATLEEIQADNISVLASCTIGWNDIQVDGEDWSCSYDKAVALYTRFAWIREQVEQFIADRANYLQD